MLLYAAEGESCFARNRRLATGMKKIRYAPSGKIGCFPHPIRNLFLLKNQVVIRHRLMTSMINNPQVVQIPAGPGKKPGTSKKRASAKGIFGLLPDWKIDTQEFRDELRD
jgi:hypothetical protein